MKFQVKAEGARGSSYRSKPKSEDEVIGSVTRMIRDLWNPCFEHEITIVIKGPKKI